MRSTLPHQVATGRDGSVSVNRNFTTSEANLNKAFSAPSSAKCAYFECLNPRLQSR